MNAEVRSQNAELELVDLLLLCVFSSVKLCVLRGEGFEILKHREHEGTQRNATDATRGLLQLPPDHVIGRLKIKKRLAFVRNHVFDFRDEDRMITCVLRALQPAFQVCKRAI